MLFKITQFLHLRTYINKYRNSDNRSKELMRNIMLSFSMRIATVLSSLLIVPMTINYINPTQYGIWLTVSSIIGWMVMFDLGLGNGFRNKFATAKAEGNVELAQQYVSTTYAAISCIVFITVSIFIIINNYIDWSEFLHLDSSYKDELSRVFAIICLFTGINMIAKVFSTLLIADQKPGLASVIEAVGQYLSLLAIFILTKTSEGSLEKLALYYSGVPFVVLIVVSVYMFRFSRYRIYRPTLSSIKMSLVKNILGLGSQFFIIYLCLIVIFQVINLVITREIGALGVTQYNIANKYFSILLTVMNIILTPVWSAFTDAYAKKDYTWMRSILRRFELMWLGSILIGLTMLLIAPFFYNIWIGDAVYVPFVLSFMMMIFVLCQSLGQIYMMMINGIGFIRIQLIIYVIFALLSWNLFTIFAQNFGIIGVLVIPSIAYFLQGIVGRIQIYKILNGKAVGIWAK